MHPNKVHPKMFGKGHQPLSVLYVDTHLWRLPQIEIAGMDINHHISPFDILDDSMCRLFGHRPLRVTRKNTVHIQIEVRYATLDCIDTKRVQCWIYFQRTIQ